MDLPFIRMWRGHSCPRKPSYTITVHVGTAAQSPSGDCNKARAEHPYSLRLLVLLFVRMVRVNRILICWPLHANRDIHGRLINVVVFPETLESLRQHLNAQLAIRHSVEVCLAVSIGFDLESAARLLPILLYGMHDHAGIAYRFIAVISNHKEVQCRSVFLRK